MLTQLRMQNFKGWQDTGPIRMAPITLFFGANSSGKSSISHFLMMLKQTAESPDRKAVFFPGHNNSAVQLGSFQEMIFHRDLKRKISFDYRWTLQKLLTIKDALQPEVDFSGDELRFCGEVAASTPENNTPHVSLLEYQLLKNKDSTFSIQLKKQAKGTGYAVSASPNFLVKRDTDSSAIDSVDQFYGFPDEFLASYKNADFVRELSLAQEQLFASLYYLGPLRTKAERLYTWSGFSPESTGFSGMNAVAAILSARDRKVSIGDRPFEEVIASALKQMGLIDKLVVKLISKQRQAFEVKIQTRGSKDLVDLPDVGFGVSQVLPVLVQIFYAPSGSTIIIEQPELHLHPSAQADLADVMIDAIHSKENGKDRNIQLIIESHSEHFLRRLQRRIAEDRIAKQKVSAYFANITHSPATLDPLEIDIFGNIQNWPENFFGDEMRDILEHAKAALNKRESENSERSR